MEDRQISKQAQQSWKTNEEMVGPDLRSRMYEQNPNHVAVVVVNTVVNNIFNINY